jgi:hypothetical protein
LQDLIRISVGTEHIDDIIHDFEQSFAGGAAKPDAEVEVVNSHVAKAEVEVVTSPVAKAEA